MSLFMSPKTGSRLCRVAKTLDSPVKYSAALKYCCCLMKHLYRGAFSRSLFGCKEELSQISDLLLLSMLVVIGSRGSPHVKNSQFANVFGELQTEVAKKIRAAARECIEGC